MSKDRPKKEKGLTSILGYGMGEIKLFYIDGKECGLEEIEEFIEQAKTEAKIEVMEEVVEKFWQKWEGRVVEECTMDDYMATFSLMGDMMTMLSNLKKKKK